MPQRYGGVRQIASLCSGGAGRGTVRKHRKMRTSKKPLFTGTSTIAYPIAKSQDIFPEICLQIYRSGSIISDKSKQLRS